MTNILLQLRAYTDCSFGCHGNGKSHYGYCYDFVADDDEIFPDAESTSYDPIKYGTEGPRHVLLQISHGASGQSGFVCGGDW